MTSIIHINQPINTKIVWFTLIIEIITIFAIYKIYLIKKMEALEKNKEAYNKFLFLKEDLKYWLYGNIVVMNTVFLIVILSHFIDFYEGVDNLNKELFRAIFAFLQYKIFVLSLTLILTSLTIKFIRQNMSLRYYGSICLLTIMIGYPCIMILQTLTRKIYSYFEPINWYFPEFPIPIFISFLIIFPIIGGSIVDICRYIVKLK
jgi:hypothetical protein